MRLSLSGVLCIALAGCGSSAQHSALQPSAKDAKDMSLSELEQAQTGGDSQAGYELGRRFYFGQAVPRDYAQAAEHFRFAAELDHRDAMYNLGVLYQHGQGVPVDERESFRWYLRAAERGQPEATKFVALMYKLGVGVEQNYPEAMKWFQKSAEFGNTAAYTSIAQLYLNGWGVAQDNDLAREWYLKAADAGDENAYGPLYLIYFSGRGVPANDAEARKWLAKLDATESGRELLSKVLAGMARDNPDDMFGFGKYLEDKGRTDQAQSVMELAARSGSARAQDWLATHR